MLSFVLSHVFLGDGENLFYVFNQYHLAKKWEEAVTKEEAASWTLFFVLQKLSLCYAWGQSKQRGSFKYRSFLFSTFCVDMFCFGPAKYTIQFYK